MDKILQWMIPVMAMAIGFAMSYGLLSGDVTRNTEQLKDMAPYVRSIDSRLSRIEGALDIRLNPGKIQFPRLGVQ